MKAVVIGATTPAMEGALRLRLEGYDVKIFVASTFLGEDFTGTWRYFPLQMQSEGRKRLKNLLLEYASDPSLPLLNGNLKKQFLKRMDEAGIPVTFMTRAIGVKSQNGRITHVLLADKLGQTEEPCDLLIDGTLHFELSHFLSAAPICIKAHTGARLMFEYIGMKSLPVPPENSRWHIERGPASDNHAYLIAEARFQTDISCEQARKQILKNALSALPFIRNSPEFENTSLIGSFSPVIDAEIEPPDKAYPNLYLPGEALIKPSDRVFSSPPPTSVRKIACDVLVVGAGTAGIRAALAARRENASVCLAEFFTTLGGTRTTGGIQPPYDGNRNRLFLEMWKALTSFADKTGGVRAGRTAPASEALLYEQSLMDSSVTLIRPAVAFDVKRQGRFIQCVRFAAPDCIYEVEALNIIDATGDADIAVFAGAKTFFGDDAHSFTQNYSQMHIVSETPYDVPMADQDVINQTDRSEWTRCIRQNTYRCAPFDMVEMLTVRESRRIDGRSTITYSDVYRNRRPADVIYDCMSDYDTHSRCFSEIGRYGVLPSHAPLKFVSVPFGALLPKDIDNLIVCAKAVSADQEAAAHLRMSPDIMCIGHICGVLAARSCAQKTPLPEISLTSLQREMYALGAIIKMPASEDVYENTPQMLASRLASGDESAFSEALLCNWEALPDLLYEIRACKAESNRILTSMVLLYYGDVSCAQDAADALSALDREYGVKSRKDVYTGKIIMGGDALGRDPYYKIIALVMLLAKNSLTEYAPLIEGVMNHTCIGEEFFLPSLAHPIVRPDMHVHGNFDRMLSLACAARMMPDARFADPIMRMYRLQTQNPHRAPVFCNSWLELELARAACLCGHPEAKALLEHMRSSPYQVIRNAAGQALNQMESPSISNKGVLGKT